VAAQFASTWRSCASPATKTIHALTQRSAGQRQFVRRQSLLMTTEKCIPLAEGTALSAMGLDTIARRARSNTAERHNFYSKWNLDI
jgi:hypothetical protein